MLVTPAVVICSGDFERRARLLPWGIEVQVWKLVETLTLPETASGLPINALFEELEPGAVPTSCTDDETTLENPIDDSPPESGTEVLYEGSDQTVRR